MSDANPAARALPPRWMPIGDEPELCSAGEWWDAVRAVEAVGRRAIEILGEGDDPVGPVILDHGGPEPRLYFLVPVGTAVRWEEPGTVALGLKCHVVVPSAESATPPGDALARLSPWSSNTDPTRGSASGTESGTQGATRAGGGSSLLMALSISSVLLLGIVVVVLFRGKSVKPGPAIACVLFGFSLASTSMAPSINRFMTSMADMIGQIRF